MLTRKYIVQDPDYNGGFVIENVGREINGEVDALNKTDERDKVLEVAELVGVRFKHRKEAVKCFRII